MDQICVFAGTTEGRELIGLLCDRGIRVRACVATEYGELLLEPRTDLTVTSQRLDTKEMEALFATEQFRLVVDATHPYATAVTDNIAAACQQAGLEYLRLNREAAPVSEACVYVADMSQAVEYLKETTGRVLVTTGSKELATYTALLDYQSRLFVRVLPMIASLQECEAQGIPPSHIIAMQGPFDEALNYALLKSIGASYLVTKESGSAGGFAEKLAAAAKAGVTAVVIGRPPQRAGFTYPQAVAYITEKFTDYPLKRQVAVVGIGTGSPDQMTGAAIKAIKEADMLIGAKRMLQAADNFGKPCLDAILPDDILRHIKDHPQHRRVAVLLSGDVGFYSGAKKLLPLLADFEVTLHCGISSVVYFSAKIGLPWEDMKLVSLHGREGRVSRELREHPKVFALVGGSDGIAKLCRELSDSGLGDVMVYVGERLSYPDEAITTATADQLTECSFDPLSVAVLVNQDFTAPKVTYGLPDDCFVRGEVPMTKSEVRSVSLSKLELTRDAVVYDIGAGTGSVSVEAALLAKEGRVYAVERNPEGIALIRQNIAAHRLDNIEVIEANAPEGLAELPTPTHAFIGGSGGKLREILRLLLDKNPHVRIVANLITLESIGEITACLREFGFGDSEVAQLSVAKSKKAGAYHLMMGQNPVYIVTCRR